MDVPVKSKAFLQQYEARNEKSKAKVRTIMYGRAYDILQKRPFEYSARICDEVAADILDKGAKLMTNASAESTEDKEMKELNYMGDTFQGLQSSTLLFISVDGQNHDEDKKLVENLLPMPTQQRYNVKKHDVTTLPECLEKVKPFVLYTAARSLSTSVVVLGEYTEDGVVFGNGATIPREILEREVGKMMRESDEPCPMVLDLVFLNNEKKQIAVSTIPKSETSGQKMERFVIQSE